MSSLLKSELEKEFVLLEKASSKLKVLKKSSAGQKLRDLLPTQRHGIKKRLKQLKAQNSKPKFVDPGRKYKFGFLEADVSFNQTDVDEKNVSKNLEKIAKFSQQSKKTTSLSIEPIHQHTERLQCHYTPKSLQMEKELKPRKKRVLESGTVFSEEDFEKFSQECFIHSKPIHPSTLVKKKSKFEDFYAL